MTPEQQKPFAEWFAWVVGFGAKHYKCDFDGKYPEVEPQICYDALQFKSVYLFGTVGPGKTALLSAMLKRAFISLGNEYRGPYYHVPTVVGQHFTLITHAELVDLLHDDLRDDAAEFQDLESVPFLLVDDIGAGHEDLRGFHLAKLEQLIDFRWRENMTTWITGNIEPAALKKLPGWERIYDRLGDPSWCDAFRIAGPSRRRGK